MIKTAASLTASHITITPPDGSVVLQSDKNPLGRLWPLQFDSTHQPTSFTQTRASNAIRHSLNADICGALSRDARQSSLLRALRMDSLINDALSRSTAVTWWPRMQEGIWTDFNTQGQCSTNPNKRRRKRTMRTEQPSLDSEVDEQPDAEAGVFVCGTGLSSTNHSVAIDHFHLAARKQPHLGLNVHGLCFRPTTSKSMSTLSHILMHWDTSRQCRDF